MAVRSTGFPHPAKVWDEVGRREGERERHEWRQDIGLSVQSCHADVRHVARNVRLTNFGRQHHPEGLFKQSLSPNSENSALYRSGLVILHF